MSLVLLLRFFLNDAWGSVWGNKLRSGLSILGIVIGIMSITVFLAIGKGAEAEIRQYIDVLAAKKLDIGPDWGMGGEGSELRQSLRFDEEDIMFLRHHVPGIVSILPSLHTSIMVHYDGRDMPATALGIFSGHFFENDEVIVYGSFPQASISGTMPMVLVNQAFVRHVFLNDQRMHERPHSPDYIASLRRAQGAEFLGATVMIGQRLFRIGGILGPSRNPQPWDQPLVYVVWGDLVRFVTGKPDVESMTILLDDSRPLVTVQQHLWYAILSRFGYRHVSQVNLVIKNMSQFQEEQEQFAKQARLILMGIGAISLVVGGIGVMNMMLVSVTERTREIGIRKAIGAQGWHIVSQFLIESMMISLIGGVIALGASYGIVRLLRGFDIPVLLTPDVAVMACCFAIGVGVVFGSVPAWKASKLRPIDALRFE